MHLRLQASPCFQQAQTVCKSAGSIDSRPMRPAFAKHAVLLASICESGEAEIRSQVHLKAEGKGLGSGGSDISMRNGKAVQQGINKARLQRAPAVLPNVKSRLCSSWVRVMLTKPQDCQELIAQRRLACIE